MSGLVDWLNVSVMTAAPELSLVEERYSSPSSPFICCSITWVTVFSSVWAEAPG